MNVTRYSALKSQEARQRRQGMRLRGTRAALARQREVSLAGHGVKWEITNFRQVAAAMAKWV